MVFEGEYLKHVPLILLEDDDLIFSSIYTDFTGKGTERYQDVPLASWVKIDISQKKQIDGTVRRGKREGGREGGREGREEGEL